MGRCMDEDYMMGARMDEDYMTGANMDDIMYMTNDDMAKVVAITDHVMDTLITDASLRKGVANAVSSTWRGVKAAAGGVKAAAGRAGHGAGEKFDRAEDKTVGAGNYVKNRAKAMAKAMRGTDQETVQKRQHKDQQAHADEYQKMVESQAELERAIAKHPHSRRLQITNGGS